jgi:hypothetical protein
MKDFDLQPKEWTTERPKPNEPIFGPQWPGALAWIVGFALVFSITYYFRN